MSAATSQLSDEEREEIRQVLEAHKAAGVDEPVLPLMGDVDGDGVWDFYGLDEAGQVVVVPGATLDDTVYEATGDDHPESGVSTNG